MTQLAKHWSHKFEVEHDERQARIVLPAGTLRMTTADDGLVLIVETEDEATLARLETVVADHLRRFAFREPDLALEWTRA
jgi:hypothetical protein